MILHKSSKISDTIFQEGYKIFHKIRDPSVIFLIYLFFLSDIIERNISKNEWLQWNVLILMSSIYIKTCKNNLHK